MEWFQPYHQTGAIESLTQNLDRSNNKGKAVTMKVKKGQGRTP